MNVGPRAFTPVENSLFLTLAGRALDSRAAHSFLGDSMSEDVARKIGYDLASFPMAPSKTFDIAVRAKRLDEVVRRFVAAHRDAIGLDLGAGLDTRIFRTSLPDIVDWYDIDFPRVIAARRQVMPHRPNAHLVATDLTDPNWLDEVIPRDRPAVIVADGLVAFLSEQDFTDLLNRLTSHFPFGQLAFNGYTPFHVWALKHYRGTASIADVVRHPGFVDPHQPERWAPRLRLVEEILLTRAPEVADLAFATRFLTRLAARSVAWSRRGTTILRYAF